ncbi:STAS domain-containing protein [Actinacidiphila alni]|uniref:STAS domain-containing protein n=1 Tax=Actinacidiphila alni TaxID=380248 RepID=UPI0015A696CD|nr:STAS domain-containing protein [Actinacidiphila alni]
MITHPSSGLIVHLTHADGAVWATVSGEIDHANAETFGRALTGNVLRACDRLEVDLSRVDFFDCTGLNALLKAAAVADRTGATLHLSDVSPAVRRLLDLTGTGPLLGRTGKDAAEAAGAGTYGSGQAGGERVGAGTCGAGTYGSGSDGTDAAPSDRPPEPRTPVGSRWVGPHAA